MANVIINDTNLTNIANAIRQKNYSTTTYKPSEMATAILALEGGSLEIPDDAFRDGYPNNAYRFYNINWNWMITSYGTRFKRQSVHSHTFYDNTLIESIPFVLRFSGDNGNNMDKAFYGCSSLKAITLIEVPNAYVAKFDADNMFYCCYQLNTIANNAFGNAVASYSPSQETTGTRNSIFYNCWSLRELPDLTYIINKETENSLYKNMAYGCYTLNEINNLPVSAAELTTDQLSNTTRNCYRLKNFKFAIESNGAPKTAKWKSQTLDLSSYVGWLGSTDDTITGYNSGITASTKVTDSSTYNTHKDSADYWTNNVIYSRYNHDSAVATINSLPDTSSYLIINGGTNTIKFKGEAGSATSGGAINTLTEAEIAIATAKGWTVSYV